MSFSASTDRTVVRLREENQALRRAVDELTILNDISREIGALADLDEVLRRIVARSVAALEAEEGVITLVDADERTRGTTLIRSMATRAERGPFHLNEHVIGWMQLHRCPLRAARGSQEERLILDVADSRVQAILGVPLLARARLVGVLTVYNPKDKPSFDEEDQRLLSIIGSQSAQVIENARLYEEERALLQMQDELRLAYEIQTRLLPSSAPQLPGYEIAGKTLPAQQVGGDFFDYIALDSGRTAVCLGDVSGKGLPAALLAASAQATIRGQSDAERTPAETVARVNWQIYRSIKRGSFLTLFHGELYHRDHRFRYVNAGHNRPILMRGGAAQELLTSGLGIGLVPQARYEEGEVELQRGDVLLVYSDGLTEAPSATGEQFGEDRLVAALREHASQPAAAMAAGLIDTIRSFTGTDAPRDDMTLIIIARR